MPHLKAKVLIERQRECKAIGPPKKTATGYHLKFVSNTLDIVRPLKLKRSYLVMDNAPIYTSNKIDKMMTRRG